MKCPFRKDCQPGWLGKNRIEQIVQDTVYGDQYFSCHETIDKPSIDESLCAGKLIFEGKVNRFGNSSTRVGMALGLIPKNYDFKNQEIIFDRVSDIVNHHS